jgi:hypothetical protein
MLIKKKLILIFRDQLIKCFDLLPSYVFIYLSLLTEFVCSFFFLSLSAFNSQFVCSFVCIYSTIFNDLNTDKCLFFCMCTWWSYETILQAYVTPRNKWFRVAKRIFLFLFFFLIQRSNKSRLHLSPKKKPALDSNLQRKCLPLLPQRDNICTHWQVDTWLCYISKNESKSFSKV